ncbi:GNAT family N-acetyltransferase [Patescibacteria group bacterium]|nr:GNAT family N-acetyltransferase [Patescibacteria group bacterium]MBU1123168.1 GNAT family N-acetyltransferase [Patescibacteria group bacterium]
MITEFSIDDQKLILDYTYKRERENLFTIGSFSRPDPFKNNIYLGYYEDDELKGIATYFCKYGNLVINFDVPEAAEEFVKEAVRRSFKIENIANFEKYASATLRELKKYGIEPKKVEEQMVYELDKDSFTNFSKGNECLANKEDIDDLVRLSRILSDRKNPDDPITDRERNQIAAGETFIIREDDKIVSMADIHGISEHCFQLGGVVTHPDYRNMGLAKQVVSALCEYHFNKGPSTVLLFTENSNLAAQKVYKDIGFEVRDGYCIANF